MANHADESIVIDPGDQNVLDEDGQSVSLDPLLECCSKIGHGHGAIQRHDA